MFFKDDYVLYMQVHYYMYVLQHVHTLSIVNDLISFSRASLSSSRVLKFHISADVAWSCMNLIHKKICTTDHQTYTISIKVAIKFHSQSVHWNSQTLKWELWLSGNKNNYYYIACQYYGLAHNGNRSIQEYCGFQLAYIHFSHAYVYSTNTNLW